MKMANNEKFKHGILRLYKNQLESWGTVLYQTQPLELIA
jgi:hypothetical protein